MPSGIDLTHEKNGSYAIFTKLRGKQCLSDMAHPCWPQLLEGLRLSAQAHSVCPSLGDFVPVTLRFPPTLCLGGPDGEGERLREEDFELLLDLFSSYGMTMC